MLDLHIAEDDPTGPKIAALLAHLLGEARARGYARVSLETGRPAAFEPARKLYRSHGFAECPPFGGYLADDFSICMTGAL